MHAQSSNDEITMASVPQQCDEMNFQQRIHGARANLRLARKMGEADRFSGKDVASSKSTLRFFATRHDAMRREKKSGHYGCLLNLFYSNKRAANSEQARK